ncbi:MAG TPA: arylsulfatase [Chthoniobacteraceae bacterium]|nr:arylsulfatase [Chthoniobacteraceae bacterium]
MNTSQPNLILIMADQMRGDCLGIEGSHPVETPYLDFLAAGGTRFRHAYTAVPSCLPARASLITGMDQWHAGLLGMGSGQGTIPNDFPNTLPRVLRDAGYQTQLIGKGHFSPARAMMGFEGIELDESGRHERQDYGGKVDDYRAWFRRHAPEGVTPVDHGVPANSWMARPWHTAEHLHPSAWTASRAIEFLDRRDTTRPFYLNLSFARPHSPYVPPEHYFRLYEGRTQPAAIGDWVDETKIADEGHDPNAWRTRLNPRQVDRGRAGYYGEISFLDTQIGRVLTHLSRIHPDTLANTWILFVADHGDMIGDHHLWRKTYAYEGSARIPMIVKAPSGLKLAQRRVATEVSELRDIMPTLLEAAGLPIPATVTGRSLLGPIEAEQNDWRDYLHGEHCTCYSPEQEMQYVTDGRRKFIWLPRVGTQQFFDLEADPQELRNLINDPARAEEITLWRNRLIGELRAREAGWCEDGTLSCRPGPLHSPYRSVRYQG